MKRKISREESFNYILHHIEEIILSKRMVNHLKKYIKYLYVPAGAILGLAYYYFIGCKNGCPIQSNPYLSTLYGAVLGLVLTIPNKKKIQETDDNQRNDN